MSSNPLRFPAVRREVSFDEPSVRKIITDLLVQTTTDVESEQVEIKSWCKDEKELAEKVAEACSCLANTSGGFVVVGVADSLGGQPKFSPCPYPAVTTAWLQTNVHNLTKPPVQVVPFDARNLLADVIGCTGNNLYVLRVARTSCISGHLNNKGVSKVRVGKECLPQYVAEDDRSNATVPSVTIEDLSAISVDWGIAQHQKHFKTSATWADRQQFLQQARLIRPDEDCESEFEVSLAALLLFGKASAIERHVPYFETVVVVDKEPRRIRKNIIDSVRELCLGDNSILQTRVPQIPNEVLKELVVNAFVHRCYRTPSPIIINVSEMEGLEIRSPGGLLSGLSVNDLIHGVPIYRNLLLADGARFVGLCDKIGRGIDLIFEGVLSEGLGFPEFDSGATSFTARIPLAGSAEFKQFLRARAEVLGNLDEVIVLRMLWGKNCATLDDLSASMQRKRETAERVLNAMSKKNMVEVVDQFYRLTAGVRRDIETIFKSDQLSMDDSLWS
jgi:ATP-dependent DNA helicase RecG